MAVQYTNRKRITYYLHEDNTKTGDLRYFFSTKNEGNLVDTLPKGTCGTAIVLLVSLV